MILKQYVLTAAMILSGIWLSSLVVFPFLPDRVPIHWNIHGQVDRYGSPLELALLIPISATIVVIFMVFLPRVGALREDFARFSRTYGRIIVLIATMMMLVHGILLTAGMGMAMPIQGIIFSLLGALFAMLGNWMGKIRRNSWIGIRTPWTLVHDTVWERTHRLGGRLFLVHGILVVVLGLLCPPMDCVVLDGWWCNGNGRLVAVLFASAVSGAASSGRPLTLRLSPVL